VGESQCQDGECRGSQEEEKGGRRSVWKSEVSVDCMQGAVSPGECALPGAQIKRGQYREIPAPSGGNLSDQTASDYLGPP